MLRFSRLRRFAVLIATLLLAACGSEPRRAGAQDMSELFLKPAAEHLGRPQVLRTPARTFSTSDPARILVIGDSLAQGFGIYLDRRVKERKLAAVVINRGRTSTGLARSDFYDWPANLAAQLAELRPDIVVVHFGSNDNQSIVLPGGNVRQGSAGWPEAYRAQTQRILDIAAAQPTMVYWIGPAPDRRVSLNAHLTRINPIFQAEALASSARYFPLSIFAAGPDGAFVRDVPVNGRMTTIRSGDGSHFTGTGYYLVADRLLQDMAPLMPSMFNAARLELAGALQ